MPSRNLYARMVAQLRARLGNVGKRDRHVAGLGRLAVKDGLLAERGFQQFDQLGSASPSAIRRG